MTFKDIPEEKHYFPRIFHDFHDACELVMHNGFTRNYINDMLDYIAPC